jgi:hypothetical protein
MLVLDRLVHAWFFNLPLEDKDGSIKKSGHAYSRKLTVSYCTGSHMEYSERLVWYITEDSLRDYFRGK